MTDKEYLKKYLDKDKLEEGLNQLKQEVPVQYIVGNVDFYDINLEVNKNVLIPRFETELLVEKTINYSKNIFKGKIDILDIGTGSGAIAISLSKHLDANVTALDISTEALEIAKKNATKNNQKINFIQSDILKNVTNKYDIIISNPPYISKNEQIDTLVYNNEPHIALFAPNDGLYFYEQILKEIKPYLKDKHLIAFEIGMSQANEISNIINKYLPNSKISVEKDLTGKDRYIFIF